MALGRPLAAAWLVAAIVGLSPVLAAGEPTLAEVAKAGDALAVARLLDDGADPNWAWGDGRTALHWAAENGHADVVRVLLARGARSNPKSRLGGFTPMLLASRGGHDPVVALLLEAGVSAAQATAMGATALMLAAGSGQAATVERLLLAGADPNAAERVRGQTALMVAAARGRAAAIRALARHGANIALVTRSVDLGPFIEEELGGGQAGDEASQARRRQMGGHDRQHTYGELVGHWGGLAALHLAARQGSVDAAVALLDAGADLEQPIVGDGSTALLVAIINGHFDLAMELLRRGASPNATQFNGVTPLYAVLNCRWAPKAAFPQPRAFEQQETSYLDLMTALLDRGAETEARVTRKVWYTEYDVAQLAVDEVGATAFWRAAYAADVTAMRLLVLRGADAGMPTTRTPGRPRAGDAAGRPVVDVSGRPPMPVGGPAIPPILAASGQGYGEGFAANHHRFAPGGMLAAVRYLVEETGADVNATDHEFNTPLHNAAARGDNDMIRYLLDRGADPMAVNRWGQTTVDMANGPVERIAPFPETIALLEALGVKKNHQCVSC